MSKEIDWSKAPEGATHYLPETEKYFASWIKPGFSMREESQLDWVEDEDDSAEHLYVARPKVWNGEVLPPVGTACEIKFGHWNDWETCTILCIGEKMVFVRQLTREGHTFEGSMNLEGIAFRPIRTAEQIAADEIQQIRDEIGYQRPQLGICPVEAMYKLGYRKCSE